MSDGRARSRGRAGRPVRYCVVPAELATKLHESLRRHFRDDPAFEVIVERRHGDRRAASERRDEAAKPPRGEERRRIRATAGRRVGERRAPLVAIDPPAELPRAARAHAERLLFLERLEPTGQQLEDDDTARLVARLQAGEEDLFAQLYLRYFDRVYAYLRVALDDPHEAEDATQQVFMQVLEALPAYERRAQPFRAWLFRIVRNHAVGLLRRSKRMQPVDPAEIAQRRDAPEDAELAADLLDWISDRELLMFVERLPLAQRQVLILRYTLDLTDKQIASILGRSYVDVRTLQHRGLTYLRQRLAAVGRRPAGRERSQWHRRLRQAPVLRRRRFVLGA